MAYQRSRRRAGGGQLGVVGGGFLRAYFSGWGAFDEGRHSSDVGGRHWEQRRSATVKDL